MRSRYKFKINILFCDNLKFVCLQASTLTHMADLVDSFKRSALSLWSVEDSHYQRYTAVFGKQKFNHCGGEKEKLFAFGPLD